MSTISSSAISQLSVQRPPPHDLGHNRIASTISSELSSGALSSTDATALSGALDAINASLSSDNSSLASGSNATGSRLDPASMKDRINSLIAGQVNSGALTSDQASELKNLFASGGGSTTASDSASGASNIGGPPPEPSPNSASSASGSSAGDLLSTFLQQLQASQSSNAGYSANGSSQSGMNASARLVDFRS